MNLKSVPFNLSDSDIEWVNSTLSGMTTEEKIAQLFCLITYTDDENYLRYLAGGLKVGGVMTRTMSLTEIVNTVTRLQQSSKIPMLISANLEAGLNQACYEGTRVGCQMGIAATGDKKYAGELGRIIGEEASALGIN
ncbi:MAG: beta-hexosaminidase, partial [Clostridiales bacterium]|nr:beta-hexosaminidase [Clostridiales bacterium]